MSAARISLRGLYAITPETADTANLIARVEACLEGGAAVVQYRAKGLARDVSFAQARAIARRCRDHGAYFIVNDSVEVAREAGADGVHVGRDDARADEIRRDWPEAIIGVSCYADATRALDAAAAGADYVAIGSMFASPTKPAAVHASLDLLRQARELSHLPVVAIGGITLGNARRVIDAGADMVAVVSALFDARDVEAAARAFHELFEAPPTGVLHVRP